MTPKRGHFPQKTDKKYPLFSSFLALFQANLCIFFSTVQKKCTWKKKWVKKNVTFFIQTCTVFVWFCASELHTTFLKLFTLDGAFDFRENDDFLCIFFDFWCFFTKISHPVFQEIALIFDFLCFFSQKNLIFHKITFFRVQNVSFLGQKWPKMAKNAMLNTKKYKIWGVFATCQ